MDKPARRILHTSDLHLQTLDDPSFRDFESLLAAIDRTGPDLVVIAGDLFDHHRIKDDLNDVVVENLSRLGRPVVILPGNHDCLTPESPYLRTRRWEEESNIHLFRSPQGEIMRFNELGISLWGKPITSYNGDLLPLAGIPERNGTGSWHIAVAHGLYVIDGQSSARSYLITHEDIVNTGWDYVALGHMNLFNCICDDPVTAYYSGSPAISGGVAVVDLCEIGGISVTQHIFTEH